MNLEIVRFLYHMCSGVHVGQRRWKLRLTGDFHFYDSIWKAS